jgi:hypothetical protein
MVDNLLGVIAKLWPNARLDNFIQQGIDLCTTNLGLNSELRLEHVVSQSLFSYRLSRSQP